VESALREKRNGAVNLFRGREVIPDLFSALGDLRETRLTAVLGYLIAEAPGIFGPLFLNRGAQIEEVKIEASEESRRYDLLLQTPKNIVVVEAKVGYTQSPSQVKRYVRSLVKNRTKKEVLLYLLDKGGERLQTEIQQIKKEFSECEVRSKTWAEVARSIERVCAFKRFQNVYPKAAIIAGELVKYLKENQMAPSEVKEIYIRQLSGDSLELFFKHHIYKCQPNFAKNALQHIYFAPLFTAKAPADFASRSMLPIEKGLSYIARIITGRVVKRNQVCDFLLAEGHPNPKEASKEVLKQTPRKEFLVLMLGQPYQLFHTPLSSKKLGVKGLVSQKSASLDELLSASRTGA
jgi:PD-(D/E)XK nuclease superfamily